MPNFRESRIREVRILGILGSSHGSVLCLAVFL
jgi:hypothetical protein